MVSLLIQCPDKKNLYGKTYNVGSGKGISIVDSVNIIKKYVPSLQYSFIPWPELEQKVETGDYVNDIRLITKDANWLPEISFEAGIKKTVSFYKSKL